MSNQEIDQLVDQDYKYGFVTDIESDTLPPGLNENVIREISKRKKEPEWLLEWRLEAYQKWLQMTPPDWAHLNYQPIHLFLLTNHCHIHSYRTWYPCIYQNCF